MSTASDMVGSIDTAELQKLYPDLAIKIARDTAKEAGLDYNDPGTITTAMQSGTFRTRAEELQGKSQNRALTRLMRPSVETFDTSLSPDAALSRGYTQQADAIRRTGQGRQILFGQMMEENQRLAKLADFNETAYTRKRLAELKPTEDIDRQILDLRNRALFSKAAMFDRFSNLPYGAQTRAVAAMQKMFIDQIDELQTLRTARVNDAKDKVQEEIDAYGGRVKASEARMSGLSKAIDILREQGADEQDLAKLMVDFSQEKEKLRKARAQGAAMGLSATKDVIEQALIGKYKADHRGEIPDESARVELKRQAEFIAKNRGDLTQQILGAQGDYNRLSTPGATVTKKRNMDIYDAIPFSEFFRPSTITEKVPGRDVLGDAGFGVPFSTQDKAELLRKLDLANVQD